MVMLLTVPCTVCGERKALVTPSSAAEAAKSAVCAECAQEIDDTALNTEIASRQAQLRREAITKGWEDRTPALYQRHDLLSPDKVAALEDKAVRREPLLVYGPNAAERSALLWRYCTLLGNLHGLHPNNVGGGYEYDTLALATTADYKMVSSIRREYLNPAFKAVIIDGIGEGRFANATRRHDEWATLARQIVHNNQLPIFTTSFGTDYDPNIVNRIAASSDLQDWIGPTASALLSQVYG